MTVFASGRVTEALTALRMASDQVVELLRRAGDSDRPIPHLEWTVGACAVHLVTGVYLYRDQALGSGLQMPIEMAAQANQWAIDGVDERRPAYLADRLVRAVDELVSDVAELADDSAFPFWSGGTLRLPQAMWLLVGEQIVHGWDIARGLDTPWPIDPRLAAGVFRGAMSAAPLLIDSEAAAGRRAVIELRIRGFKRYFATLADGVLRVSHEEPASRIDVHISAAPGPLLLVSYGRIKWWHAALRGQITAWGRRAWLGLSFQRLLASP